MAASRNWPQNLRLVDRARDVELIRSYLSQELVPHTGLYTRMDHCSALSNSAATSCDVAYDRAAVNRIMCGMESTVPCGCTGSMRWPAHENSTKL